MDGSALHMIGQSSADVRENTKFSSLERPFSSLTLHFIQVLISIKLFKQENQKVKIINWANKAMVLHLKMLNYQTYHLW